MTILETVFEYGMYIILILSFIVSFKADLIKSDSIRKLTYFWFPFLASIALYWITNWDELIHPDQHEGGWAWFMIIQWFVVGLAGSISALLIKWILKKLSKTVRDVDEDATRKE